MRFISVPRYGKWNTKSSTSGRTRALRAMLAADRVHDHRAVVRQRARVIGDDERAPLVGDVAEPARLDAEVGPVEELEQRLDLGGDVADRARTRRPRRCDRASPACASAATRTRAAACCALPLARRARAGKMPIAHALLELLAPPRRARGDARPAAADRSTARTPTAASARLANRSRRTGARRCARRRRVGRRGRFGRASFFALRRRRRAVTSIGGGGGASLSPSPVANGSSPRICLPAITRLPSPPCCCSRPPPSSIGVPTPRKSWIVALMS